jgi:drug/metabolite transporter (DMT)-like permease
VLGTKVIFVALLTVAITREPLSAPLWIASALTMAATALLGGGKTAAGREAFARSLGYGFPAAAAFALTDVFAQTWAPAWGFGRFAPVMFLVVAVCSFALVPKFRAPLWELPPRTWRWLIPGAVVLSAQAFGIAFAIMTYGEATLVNILYASRGLWTVLLVWGIGHWFENGERGLGRAVMLRRLAGAGLLVVAVFLAVR